MTSREIRFIAQQAKKDCAIACIAMATGIEYERVATACAGLLGPLGMTHSGVEQALGALGFAVRHTQWVGSDPIAGTQGVRILDTMGHFVVLSPCGVVLDPARGADRDVEMYRRIVRNVLEVHDVRASLEMENMRAEIGRLEDVAVQWMEETKRLRAALKVAEDEARRHDRDKETAEASERALANELVMVREERDSLRTALATAEKERDGLRRGIVKSGEEIFDVDACARDVTRIFWSKVQADSLAFKENVEHVACVIRNYAGASRLRASPPAPVDVEKLARDVVLFMVGFRQPRIHDLREAVEKLIRTHLARGGTTDVGGVEGHAAVHGESRRLSPTANAESVATGSDAGTIAPSVTHGPHREDAAGIKPGPTSASPRR